MTQTASATWRKWQDPQRVFLITGMVMEAMFWGFFLGALVWWTVDLGYGPFRLILLGTVLEGTYLLAEIPTGVLADRYSRKWSVVVAYLLMGVSMVLAVITLSYWVMLVAQALFGFGWTFRSGAEVAWLTDEMAAQDPDREPDTSAIIVRRHRLAMVAGVVALVPAMFIGQWSPRGLVAIAGVVLILVSVFAAVAMTDHFREGQTEGELYALKILKSGLATARRVPSIRLLILVMLLVGLGAEALDRLGFKRFLDEGDFGDSSIVWTGLLFMVLGLVGAGVTGLAEKALHRGDSLPLVSMILLGVATIGALVAALGPVVGIAVGLALQDPCREALDPVSIAWANKHAPAESRATVLSMVSQAHGVGEFGGGLVLGVLAEAAGIRWAILLAAALWFAATLLARVGAKAEPTSVAEPAVSL